MELNGIKTETIILKKGRDTLLFYVLKIGNEKGPYSTVFFFYFEYIFKNSSISFKEPLMLL